MYRGVPRSVFESPTFYDAANVFVTFEVREPEPECTSKRWESYAGSAGVVRIDRMEGSRVDLALVDIELTADQTTAAEGRVLLSASAHADCYAEF